MSNEIEILNKLIELGIILKIGEDYHITEKYKENKEEPKISLSKINVNAKAELDYNKLLNSDEKGTNMYPFDIRESSGRAMVKHFMDYCKIPAMSKKRYRLRSVSKEAIIILEKIIKDKKIIPAVLLTSITTYYEVTEFPKSFDNYILHGLILEVYEEWISGNADIININDSDNSKWG